MQSKGETNSVALQAKRKRNAIERAMQSIDGKLRQESVGEKLQTALNDVVNVY